VRRDQILGRCALPVFLIEEAGGVWVRAGIVDGGRRRQVMPLDRAGLLTWGEGEDAGRNEHEPDEQVSCIFMLIGPRARRHVTRNVSTGREAPVGRMAASRV